MTTEIKLSRRERITKAILGALCILLLIIVAIVVTVCLLGFVGLVTHLLWILLRLGADIINTGWNLVPHR